MKYKRVNITIPAEVVQDFRARQAETGLTISEVATQALRAVCAGDSGPMVARLSRRCRLLDERLREIRALTGMKE